MHDLRLAAAAARPYPGDVPAGIAATKRWIRAAADAGAQVLILPEAVLTGYDLDRVAELALTSDHPALIDLARTAQDHGVVLSVGFLERHAEGYSVSQAWLGRELHQVYRKCHRTAWERQHCVAGDELSVQILPAITTGTLICYDSAFPAACETLVRRGAELLVTPTCNGTTIAERDHIGEAVFIARRRHHVHLYWRARAYDTSVFACYVDNVGAMADGRWYPGYAVIFGPDGGVLAEGRGGCEEMIVADLRAEDLRRARSGSCGHFHTLVDARPELYQR